MTFDQQLREWEWRKEREYQESMEEEVERCSVVNGREGDCPLNRKRCEGCRYN